MNHTRMMMTELEEKEQALLDKLNETKTLESKIKADLISMRMNTVTSAADDRLSQSVSYKPGASPFKNFDTQSRASNARPIN